MSKDKPGKPNKPVIHIDAPEGFDPDAEGLTMVDENAEDEEMDEESEQDYLYDYAMTYLPRLPQLDALLETVTLDYSVLVSARIAIEELEEAMSAEEIDDIMSALVLMGEENEDAQEALYDSLGASAQEMVTQLQDISDAQSRADITDAPVTARIMLLTGAMADLEVADELLEEIDEPVAQDELATTGHVIVALCEKGGIPATLLARAVEDFNVVAAKASLAITLREENGILHLDGDKPATPKKSPKP